MNFFGMGAPEIVIILVAALIIFGPGRLPEVAGQVGRAIRDFRRMTSDLQAEFERTTGVKELKKQVESELSGVKSQVASVGTTVQKEVTGAASTVSSAAKSATSSTTVKAASSSTVKSTSKSTTTTAKSTSTAGTSAKSSAAPPPPRATKKDPLADVSFLEEIVPSSKSKAASTGNGATDSSMTRSAATQPASATAGSNGAGANGNPDQLDALARARQRRLAAGYNRR
ncbi:MAG TPA: twin-arginine translocase TatA/TatE family subunit [Thermomicrobiales bacterium]